MRRAIVGALLVAAGCVRPGPRHARAGRHERDGLRRRRLGAVATRDVLEGACRAQAHPRQRRGDVVSLVPRDGGDDVHGSRGRRVTRTALRDDPRGFRCATRRRRTLSRVGLAGDRVPLARRAARARAARISGAARLCEAPAVARRRSRRRRARPPRGAEGRPIRRGRRARRGAWPRDRAARSLLRARARRLGKAVSAIPGRCRSSTHSPVLGCAARRSGASVLYRRSVHRASSSIRYGAGCTSTRSQTGITRTTRRSPRSRPARSRHMRSQRASPATRSGSRRLER